MRTPISGCLRRFGEPRNCGSGTRNGEGGTRNRGGEFDPRDPPPCQKAARSVPRSAFRIPRWGGPGMSDLWLAIDTATEIASVAVGTAGDVRSVVVVKGVRQHAAQIVPLVDRALESVGSRPRDVTRLL